MTNNMFAQAYIVPDGGIAVVCNSCQLPEHLGMYPEVISMQDLEKAGYAPICDVCGGNGWYKRNNA